MNFKEWFFNQEQQSGQIEFMIPPGTVLFHGSLEEFKELCASSYGGGSREEGNVVRILWVADNPAAAQAYIPVSGATMYVSPKHIAMPIPAQDPELRNLQRHLGIYYNYDDPTKIKWQGAMGASSFPKPEGPWQQETGYEYKRGGPMFTEVLEKYVKDKLDQMGFKSRYGNMYSVHMSKKAGEYLPPGQKSEGRLFVIKTKEPLKIYDLTRGGTREGDLTDVDYNKFNIFQKIMARGYDGIKINDYAQVHLGDDIGTENIGHDSVGIFESATKKLSWQSVPATHPDWESAREKKWTTPEYERFEKGG